MPDYNTSRWKRPTKETEEPSSAEPVDATPAEYFMKVSIFHYFCVIVGFIMFWYVCFWEDTSRFKHFGGPGHRLLYLRENYLNEMRIFFFVAILLHVVEAVYAHMICREMNLAEDVRRKWIFQTSVVGYSSLRHLIKYRKEKEDEMMEKIKKSK